MAGVAETNTIEVIGQDPDGTYLLVMIEERPWGADPGQASQLQEKINTYAGFILDGSLAQQHPETEGRPTRDALETASG